MQIGIKKPKGQLIQKREAHNKQDDILFLNQDKVPQKKQENIATSASLYVLHFAPKYEKRKQSTFNISFKKCPA